jgi:hypothetical protein
VTASTTTTIEGVSIFSRQSKRKADVFDIALSAGGIAIRRPGRNEQHMTWDRITQWELEERPGFVVLTLRGGGSVTPLIVKGWALEDLETVMRDVTEGGTGPAAEADAPGAGALTALTTAALVADVPPLPEAPPGARAPQVAVPAATPPVPRATRRRAPRPPRRSVWKTLVTIVLLGVLATAVTLVLLQSAGVISWGFLGPIA